MFKKINKINKTKQNTHRHTQKSLSRASHDKRRKCDSNKQAEKIGKTTSDRPNEIE